ncbi:MAG: metallophosphoesterase [Clostridia bacterium]|nr:metallophosphoesterase [Clostridia bacterium]
MKNIVKRSLAIALAALMLVASLPAVAFLSQDDPMTEVSANTYSAVSGTSGDATLFEKIADTSPSIAVDKENYTVGEPIYVTADNGSWVGLYRADQTDYANTKSIFWYYISGNEGRAFDIRTGQYNYDNPLGISPALFVGPYKAVLFATDDTSNPVASVPFNVADANGDTDDANSYVTTNKHDYSYGEAVVVTAKSSNTQANEAWVGIYSAGANPSTSVSFYYYYVAGYQNTSVDIKNVSVNNNGVSLPVGEYDVYLFGDSGYNKIQAQTTISIVGGTIDTDRDTYGLGEDIIVTATSCTTSSGAWVGLYKVSDVDKGFSADNPSLSWYSMSTYPCVSVVFQDLGNDANSRPLTVTEPGEYVAYVFGDSGYSDIQAATYFTIEDEVKGHFSNGAYLVDDLNDGFANGTVVLEVASDRYGVIGNTDTAVFWADADGNPLEGYTALAKTQVYKNIISFDMYTHTFIPEGAQSLMAFVAYNGKVGTQGYKIPLPTGTVTYNNLDENILSEFQMVSDLHVTSNKAKNVDGGALIDQYYHVNDNDHVQMMFEDIAENSPESVGIFANGDIANNGLKVEFEEVDSIYNSVNGTLPPMYVSLGNHDSYPGDITEFVNYANSLGADITSDAPYYAKDINGYKYIFLAGDNDAYYGLYSASNSNDAELSATQLQWLDEQLAENEANGGKPVFVMLHQAIANTVAGSFDGQDWDGVVNIDAFKAILNKYNNVILLGGHSHWEINSPNNLFAGSADLPVAINTASVGYLWSDYSGVAGGEWIEGSQGFYVRTYEDKVVFLGRDFVNQKWIPSACYVLYNEDVNAESMSLDMDEEVAVSEYLRNPKGRDVSFATSDKNIVQVDADGTITATGVGSAVVTVTAIATDSEVVTREKIKITVTNQAISDDIKEELGEPLNLGDDFSAYIGYTKADGSEYYLTIPSDNYTTDRNAEQYTTSQGFYVSQTDVTVYYPEFIEKNNAVFSVRQFWDFKRQNDGTYMIFNTWTNATHTGEDVKIPFALDGGSYSYYKEIYPIADNNVDKGLVATGFYENDDRYTTGEYTDYYRWYVYMDNDGNYYLQNKHSGQVLSICDDEYTHYFGQMGKMLNDTQKADSAVFLDRIAVNDNIKMSLFDYGKYINNNSYIAKEARKFRESGGVSTFDASKNDNILWFNQDAWNPNYVVDGVATMEESLKDSDDITVDNIGNPSQYDSTPLMLNSLDATGYPYVNNVTYHDWDRFYGDFDNYPSFGSDSGSLKYLFDQDMTYVTGDSNTELTADNYKNGYYQSVRYDVGDQYGTGMFKEASTGGMVYSSYMNAAYFDTSEFYKTGSYQPVSNQRFQLYDYVIRPYYHYYYDENTTFTDDGTTYDGIYDTLIKSTRLNTFGEDSLFNNRYLRKSMRDYNSYNRNFLPFNYGHNINSEYINGDYVTANLSGTYVDPVYPDETDTRQRTGYTSTQQDTPNLPAYYNDVYADTTGSDHTNSQEANLWFGMTMEFDFEIANNGQVYDMNGNLQDMVFNFTGDDDVLVYIDNVLVLNVAGTHGAQMATINFATGNIAHPTDESCYPSVGIDISESSTIREKFETAYAEAAQSGSNSILAGTTLNEDMFKGNTFANGTRHTLKFFYLERGGSRSFNDIYFNMETLPSSGFEVEKQVVDAEGNDVSAEDNSDYTFAITGYTSEGEALTSGTYTYDVVETTSHAVVSSNQKVEQGDTFTIKGGQKAVFKDLDVYSQYTVTEIYDPCVVKNVRTFLDGTEIGNMPTQQDHMVSCMASSYIPVVENDTSNVTFINTVDVVCVNIKYYDREVVSGKPADMGDEEKTFVYKYYGTDIKFIDEEHTAYDTEQMIADAGMALESGKFGKVNNLLDDYYLWLSQEQAVAEMQKLTNTHTGENYVETPYHTDQYGNVQTSGEKWVNISGDGKTITSWMYNCPKEYTLNAYGVTNGDTSVLEAIPGSDKYVAIGAPQLISGYYNQRLGEELTDDNNINQGVNEDSKYLNSYGLSAYTGSKPNTDKTVTLANDAVLTFQYWAFDEKGTKIASTDIDYLYRISGNETIYAIYGEGEPAKGMTVTQNQNDYFSVAGANGKSVEYVRLNTVMNPYGYEDNFHIGGEVETPGDGIKDVAVVYVNVKNNSFDVDNLTDAQLQQLREGVQTIVESAQSYGVMAGKQIEVTVETTTTDGEQMTVTSEDITLIANGFKYQVVTKESATGNNNQVYLTTKNRIQFTTTFEKAQLEKLRLFAFAAMRVVEDGESQWVVSDNYIDYNLGATE